MGLKWKRYKLFQVKPFVWGALYCSKIQIKTINIDRCFHNLKKAGAAEAAPHHRSKPYGWLFIINTIIYSLIVNKKNDRKDYRHNTL